MNSGQGSDGLGRNRQYQTREIVTVATPETQEGWLKTARGTRRELVKEIKKVKRAAKVNPGQGELIPAFPTVVAPRELPFRFQMELTPEQEARRSAPVEGLHKLGGVPNDRAELMLEALAALVEMKGMGPRRPLASRPPVQINVHDIQGRMTVRTDASQRELSWAESDRMLCDAVISGPGRRNMATVTPRIRREVLARGKHR